MYYLYIKRKNMDFSEKTYEELEVIERNLKKDYEDIFNDCAEQGISYIEFCEKAKETKKDLYLIGKYKRLKEVPIITYGKEYNGETYTLDNFKDKCKKGYFTDDDGYGVYATETSSSSILIFPSDIKENIYRKDFSNVIWFNK